MEIDIASLGRAALYLGVPFVILVFIMQYKWAKTCERNVRVLLARKGGGGDWMLAPKEGGEITIYNPATDEYRTWPVNELATIDIPYPGVGFLPGWMQKTIRLAIVNEGDWEPMLNRSPHRRKIASPDVVEFMIGMANEHPELKDEVDIFLDGISTGPTREMIADPSALGSLMRSGVLKALASVSNELMDTLKSINKKLSNFVSLNPAIVYIGLGMIGALVVFLIYQVMQLASGMELMGNADTASKIDAIYRSLGLQ